MFAERNRSRISETQADRILEIVESEELEVGDRLPGERRLASRLGVSRSSVREAIRYLEAMGVVESRVGLGTFVVSSSPSAVFASSVSAWLADHKDEVLDVFQVREALETKVAELAATNATENLIADLASVLDGMSERIEAHDVEALTALDHRFHYLLAEACGNHLLCTIIKDIQESLMESRKAILALPGRAEQSVAEHRAILEALADSDPESARQAMRDHLHSAMEEVR